MGVLKGYDQLMNLVLDDVREHLRGRTIIFNINADAETGQPTDTNTRTLGLVVVRGPTLVLISPLDGSKGIENPFINTVE